MGLPLLGKVSLVTGASRGVGAATAVKLALLGSDVIVNYRSKIARAQDVCSRITDLGRKAMAIQADLTAELELQAMMRSVEETFARLDVLILNASGGLEKGKEANYAMNLNHTAQLRTAILATKLFSQDGRIVFVTSHWAHFYGEKPVMAGYEVVAQSKHAGEQALRDYVSGLSGMGLSLVVVSGDAIEGTITPRLLARKDPGVLATHSLGHKLPTVNEFADVISTAAFDASIPSGHTIFVGATDL